VFPRGHDQRRDAIAEAVRIRDGIVNRTGDVQDLMREQLQGACTAALDVLKNAGK